ncbi:hypothetical protein EGW08_000247 [Elysia chlorotica]|uniref:Uncharacterized protein n=1 Tax=Elysia chlorotica TaxID=188477 RepID=A0A433UE39_ELYCH|nr:hypothetical protein EGW08_000247 [Elysia chlorotica]
MAMHLRDVFDLVKKQIAFHRKAEARQNTLTIQERREMLLSSENEFNSTFPWLTASFVRKLIGQKVDAPSGVLNVGYLYKIMEQLSTGQGFRTFLGVMRRNDLWCTIRHYGFGEVKNSNYLAHKLTRVRYMTSENRFFEKLITCFKTLSGFYIIIRHEKSTPLHNFIKRYERFNDEELR